MAETIIFQSLPPPRPVKTEGLVPWIRGPTSSVAGKR